MKLKTQLVLIKTLEKPLSVTNNSFYDKYVISQDLLQRLQPPSKEHVLGMDEFGRDILLRIIWGTRYSLFMGAFAVLGASVLGGIIGAVAGYYNMMDTILMRIMDVFLAIPTTLLAVAIVAAMGPSLVNVVLAIAISQTPTFARVIRAQVLTIKDQEFIEAARSAGASDARIIFRYIVPNALSPMIVQVTMGMASAILSIAGLCVLVAFAASYSGSALVVTAVAIFGASMVCLYTASTLYHAIPNIRAKKVLQVLDHAMIYILIAGSYTPFCLVTLRPEHPALAWTIFGIEWGAALAGILFKVWTTGRFRYVSTFAYVLMGWVAVVALLPLVRSLHGLGTMWLAVGGGLYTLGCVFYLWRSLPYAHMVWHLFVLAGSVCHFFCVLWHVMS